MVQEFGKQFAEFVTINFEERRQAHGIFAGNLDAASLLEKLSLYAYRKIIPGETLLFLDEIQECPNALRALRYFKEETPALHVIAAGSLIDFALEKNRDASRTSSVYVFVPLIILGIFDCTWA